MEISFAIDRVAEPQGSMSASKEKRLKILVTMPITGHKLTGFPEWLAEARNYVMKHGQVIKPAESIDYCNVIMTDAQLFGPTPIEAPKAKLSHFVIEQEGNSEDPDTVVKFQIVAKFSTDLHRWVGQMAGEEFDATFEVTDAPDDDGEESEDDGEAEADAALAEDDEQARQQKRRDERAATAQAKKNLQLM